MMEIAVSDHPRPSSPGIAAWVEGESVELTSDNDALGERVFGHCWPAMKERLARAEREPPRSYTVRVTAVTKTGRRR
jgi:hypothetical protein